MREIQPNERRSGRLVGLPRVIADLLAYVGSAIVAYGCWLAWPPLEFIVGGLFLVALGMLVAYVTPRRRMAVELTMHPRRVSESL
ncbi:MAG: hypothetical protein ACKVVP_16295 [Chloroflexota bacterium]